MAKVSVFELETAVDEHLGEVRECMFEGWATGSDNIEFVAALVRAAYGKGLIDGIRKRDEMLKWAKSMGFKLDM